ncbi:Uncharacterized protein FWK35_00021773, partial [Aphis craccivora]
MACPSRSIVVLCSTRSESYTTGENGKRVSTANTVSAARVKKLGWIWYSPPDFLRPLIPELVNLLKTHVQRHSIKFNLKLEATYNRPNVANSSENRAFKTMVVEIFPDSDIKTITEIAYMKLMKEKDEYMGRGSGFTLESIDGLLVAEMGYHQPTEYRPVLFQVGDSGKARDGDGSVIIEPEKMSEVENNFNFKSSFDEKIKNINVSANSMAIVDEENYKKLINEVLEAKSRKNKTSLDYRRLNRYDIIK